VIILLRVDPRGWSVLHADNKSDMQKCHQAGGQLIAPYYDQSGQQVEGDYKFTEGETIATLLERRLKQLV